MTLLKVREKIKIQNKEFETIQDLYETLEDFLFVQKDKEKNIHINLSQRDSRKIIFWDE